VYEEACGMLDDEIIVKAFAEDGILITNEPIFLLPSGLYLGTAWPCNSSIVACQGWLIHSRRTIFHTVYLGTPFIFAVLMAGLPDSSFLNSITLR